MRTKWLFPLFLILVYTQLSFSQTVSDFKKEFGETTGISAVFSVTDKISMWTYFAPDKQVCRAVLYTTKKSADPQELPEKVSFKDFAAIVDKIIPVNERGIKKEPFSSNGIWVTGGGVSWATFTYEKVTLVYSVSHNLSLAYNSLTTGRRNVIPPSELQSNPNAENIENGQKINDFLLSYESSKVDRVNIIWNDRKCAEN